MMQILVTFAVVALLAEPTATEELILSVPASDRTSQIAVPLPEGFSAQGGTAWRLVGLFEPPVEVPADLVRGTQPDGTPAPGRDVLVASLPPGRDEETRRFRLEPLHGESKAAFEIAEVDNKGLGVWERGRPVLVYNHGFRSKEGVPPERNRSSYVHPIYGLDGETLTDDFPEDHLHHRGLFWTWPHVLIDGKEYDLWLGGKGIEQRFERWLAREAGSATAVLGIENGWYVGDRKVMVERIRLTIYPEADDAQAIDVECTWIPTESPVTLAGAEGKSYGGLTLRFAPRTETAITTPFGAGSDDLLITRMPWADLTARFAAAPGPSGAAIFVGSDHPDFPPEWLTRHYGALCVGWPGVNPQTLEPGRPVRCPYRVWIHRGTADDFRLNSAYTGFNLVKSATWEGDQPQAGHPER